MKKELLLELISLALKNEWETSTAKSEAPNNILWSLFIWEYVILRWYDSWVHFWKLVHACTWLYRLEESRRLWRWWCKQWIGLTDLAQFWLADRSEVKICATIPLIEITDNRISEIIPVAKNVIDDFKNYRVATQS